jgi:RNA polymerase sigma-B factor
VTILKAGVSRGGSAEVEQLFAEYLRTRDPQIRDRLVLMHLSLARRLASKFVHRGEPLEDLAQVASIGLIHAVDRFEPERGTKFATYATPTIIGEIKRYFRDKAWVLKVPRALQELNAQVIQANETLTQQLARSPTIAEIAAHLGATEEETLDAMEMGHTYEMVSLDCPLPMDGTDTALTLQDEVGAMDMGLQNVETYDALRTALKHLDNRGKMIIYLRFFQGLSQTEVAQRLQMSQMHVSRLQRRALQQLKEWLVESFAEEAEQVYS